MAKKYKMNPEVKKKWVEALRSGKYAQGQNCLYKPENNAYCCLGVLCKLHARVTKKKAFDNLGRYMENYDEVPPDVVMEWAGLKPTGGVNNPTIGSHRAAELNDEYGKNFNQIADLIEKHL